MTFTANMRLAAAILAISLLFGFRAYCNPLNPKATGGLGIVYGFSGGPWMISMTGHRPGSYVITFGPRPSVILCGMEFRWLEINATIHRPGAIPIMVKIL